MFFYVRWWSFYTKPPALDLSDENANTECFENSSMFLISLYQYIVVCMAFSISKPFR